ncbi:unnamed protein product [Bursaphelenchus okinawaensis]|uniref:Uncharacterized protein n=1 Tax=Bursaphelenchus okinawaensis TaxID=465554 RepID=A0A811KJ90_9BILA|nr:unnamed protein product [Bursaphelenchus okinawaensis]CAG9104811.1 unnamed protein product [Bursaphelenchus okinawaensis]
MKYWALIAVSLLLSTTLIKAAAVDDDLEGSAHMENPDDEDFEETSGVPPEKVEPKSSQIQKVNPSQSPDLEKRPTPPPAIVTPEDNGNKQTAGFTLDVTTLAILAGTILLVVLIIVAIVVCCRKKSGAEYTRGTPSNKAYV